MARSNISITESDTAADPSVLTAKRLRRFAPGLDEVSGWAAYWPPYEYHGKGLSRDIYGAGAGGQPLAAL